MKTTHWKSFGRCSVAVTAASICAAGPQTPVAAPHIPSYLPLSPIPSLTFGQDDTCNLSGSAANPVSNVVRLHILPGLLNHLTDGNANQSQNMKLDLTSATKKCYGNKYCVDDDSGTVVTKPTPIVPVTSASTNVTRLDIDFSQNNNAIWQSDGNGWYKPILLKIMLEGASLSFIQPLGGTATDSSLAVQTDAATTTNYPTMFECRQPIETQVVGNTTISSIQIRVSRSTVKGAIGSLNIGITGKESCTSAPCFLLPIVLDPKFPNNG